ncbi:MAG: DEAD/DEAH box helicase [Spirochaetales bacterium]|nr:DEAD/DEAH box helicase [Spirochaetales bacterium]
MALLKEKGPFGSAEIWSLFRGAGYVAPTHLQQRVVPLIMRGRDVAVEAEGDSGKTAAFILPILVRIKRGKAGIKAVVLTSSLENSRKIYREFRRFSGSGKKPSFFALGVEGYERKEHRILAGGPEVVIGTPNRVIDHIRRGNLEFSSLQIAVADRSGDLEHPGFAEDVLFIHSKFPPKVQTVLIAPSLEEVQPLVAQLKRPAVVPMSSWKDSGVKIEDGFIEVHPRGREEALERLVLALPAERLLIQTPNAGEVRKVVRLLRGRQLKALALLEELSPAQANKACQSFSVGAVPILAATFSAARKRSLKWVSHTINLGLPPDAESYRPRSFVLEQVTTLGSAADYSRLQEMAQVDVHKRELPSRDQVLEGGIRRILERIRREEDASELNEYRRILRRHVPMSLRGYFMAYLFKQLGAPAAVKAPAAAKQRERQYSKLFVSIGRNRRVYPKDLTELFMTRLGLEPSQLREVKVLESYSFVEVDSSVAERAIAELSGIELNGRKLAVNHARKKEGR